jgi:type II secretory ATPase GspE/PulE/Tfp pilus assembly ATPase PilB-like protein
MRWIIEFHSPFRWKITRYADLKAEYDQTLVKQIGRRTLSEAMRKGASAIRVTQQADGLDVQYCVGSEWIEAEWSRSEYGRILTEYPSQVLNRVKVMADLLASRPSADRRNQMRDRRGLV